MRFSLVIFLSFLLFAGCEEGDFKGFTNGQVKTVSGAPVANAEIHILYPDLETTFLKSKPSVVISFTIPQSGETTLDMYRFGTSILIENVVDTTLTSGNYTFPISENLYTNGVYNYEISAPNFKLRKRMFVLRPESELLNNVKPLAITDNNGNFLIQTSIFGVGEVFNSEISSLSIPSKIEFIAIKSGEIIARNTVRVSNGIDNEVELIAN
tara:strand:- start:12553 stop:13185 length:633 start_codon:yes stop_codon:yes gene_type:complete